MALCIYNKTNNENHPFSPFPQLDKYKINSVEGGGGGFGTTNISDN